MTSDSFNVAAVSPRPAPSGQTTGTALQQAATQGQTVGASALTASPVPSLAAVTMTESDTAGKTPAETVEQVGKSVERLNEMLQNSEQSLRFELDDDSGRMVIQVMDAQTQEVIRQIPNEETLRFAQYVDGLVGMIFNKKA